MRNASPLPESRAVGRRLAALTFGAGALMGCATGAPRKAGAMGAGGDAAFTSGSSTASQGGAGAAKSSSGGAGGASAGAAGESSDVGAKCSEPIEPTQDSEFSCDGDAAWFASYVVDHSFGPGQSNGQDEFPDRLLGPPRGAGCCQGAIDSVVSLGNGGWVTLGFDGNAIVDGPGPDFIVFENAFYIGGDRQNIFAELATVAVSDDGEHWVEFPCTASDAPYGQCAGWHPTLANDTSNDLDATDPDVAGGDAFDLGDVCLSRARFVRITDRPDLDAGLDGVFDLDAVAIVNGACSE